MEVKRQLDVLDKHLAGRDWIVGDDITIADMAIGPWYGRLVQGEAYDAGEFLSVQDYKNVIAWAERFYARPAVQRGAMVNRSFGPPALQLRERHDASDFETRTEDKIGDAAE
jgi:GST-like protein